MGIEELCDPQPQQPPSLLEEQFCKDIESSSFITQSTLGFDRLKPQQNPDIMSVLAGVIPAALLIAWVVQNRVRAQFNRRGF